MGEPDAASNSQPVIDDEEVKEVHYSWVLSLRSVIASLCLVAILVSAATATLLSITSCDSALDDTRKIGDDASNGCFDTSSASLQQLAIDLLSYSAEPVSKQIDDFFEIYARELTHYSLIVSNTPINPTIPPQSFSYLETFAPSFDASITKLASHGLSFILVGVGSGPINTRLLAFHNLQPPSNVFFSRGNLTYIGLYFVNASFYPQTFGTVDIPTYHITQDITYTLLAASGHPIPNNVQWWTQPVVVSHQDFAGMITTVRLPHPRHGLVTLQLSITLHRLGIFFRNIVSTSEENLGVTTYIYALSASAWIAERVRVLNVTDWSSEVNRIVATSHGTVVVTTPTGPSLAPDVNASHPVVRGIARAINNFPGNYSAVYSLPGGAQRLSVTAENDTYIGPTEDYFVLVRKVTKGMFAEVDWWLVISVDAEYVLGAVERKQAETFLKIEAEKQVVEDQVKEDRTIMYIVVAAVGLVLALISGIITNIVLAPIRALQVDMASVAEMNLEQPEGQVSSLHEVGTMQISFWKMKANLAEFRAYMPSSLLQEEKSTKVAPSGTVTIVFTDIRSSTMLWQRSATGMNKAIEQHNDIIRRALEDNNGYEVKTIGDAFMVSFSEALDAVKFALKVQEDLASAEWPPELLIPEGLKVRIGCQVGEVILEENPLTGRSDYRGTPVNTASRVESKAVPGTLAVTDDVLAVIKPHLAELGNPSITAMEPVELKGLAGTWTLHTVASSATRRQSILALSGNLDAPQSSLSEGSRKFSKYEKASSRESQHTKLRVHDNIGKKTGLFLSNSDITVAVCKLATEASSGDVFGLFNLMIRIVTDAVGQSDGVLGTVLGRSVSVSWNTTRPCKVHQTAALRMVSQLQKRGGPSVMKVGLGTGKALHGNIGSAKSRFHTLVGLPMDAALAAADLAMATGCFGIFADCSRSAFKRNLELRCCLRNIDVWKEVHSGSAILVSEVQCDNILHVESMWEQSEDPLPEEVESHNTNFMEAYTGNQESYQKILDSYEAAGKSQLAKVARKRLAPVDGTPFPAAFASFPGDLHDLYTPNHIVPEKSPWEPDNLGSPSLFTPPTSPPARMQDYKVD